MADRALYKNEFYNQYARDVHSQNGEDGVLAEILRRLGIEGGWVCEFGAWDGVHLSNTFNVVKTGKFQAVYIEGDNSKYGDLLRTVSQHPNIVPVKAYVTHEGAGSCLDTILSATPLPTDFDILSIDIDSYDYQVWESLKTYQPKIVVIEINSAVNTNVEGHIHKPGVLAGTSFLPMLNLGKRKGYTFVLHTGNMIFVRNDLFDKLDIHYDDPRENYRTYWNTY